MIPPGWDLFKARVGLSTEYIVNSVKGIRIKKINKKKAFGIGMPVIYYIIMNIISSPTICVASETKPIDLQNVGENQESVIKDHPSHVNNNNISIQELKKNSLESMTIPIQGYTSLAYLANNPERVEKLFDWKNYSRKLRETMINSPLEEFVQDSFKEGDCSRFLKYVKFSRLEELRKSYLDGRVSEAIKLAMELKFFSHAVKEGDDGYRVHPYEKKNLNIRGLVILPDDITTKKSYKELNESLNKASMKMYGDENWMNLGLTVKEKVLIAYQATKDLLEFPYDKCSDYILFKDFFGIMKSKDHDLRSHYPIAFFNEEGGIIEGKKNHVWPGIISIYKSGIEFYSTDPASDDYFRLNIADATIGSGHRIKVIYPGEYIKVYYYPGKEKIDF